MAAVLVIPRFLSEAGLEQNRASMKSDFAPGNCMVAQSLGKPLHTFPDRALEKPQLLLIFKPDDPYSRRRHIRSRPQGAFRRDSAQSGGFRGHAPGRAPGRRSAGSAGPPGKA